VKRKKEKNLLERKVKEEAKPIRRKKKEKQIKKTTDRSHLLRWFIRDPNVNLRLPTVRWQTFFLQ
jgi:hypothetical protein